MTAEEAKAYLLYGPWPGHPHSLAPIRALMAALGNPQASLPCVHVAGTNGKGSACAMTERILRAAHLRTGLYTSPHLQDFSERIRLDGRKVSDDALIRAAERVKAAAAAISEPLTAFDAMTAAAFLVFAEAGCDVAVLEVGLGGAYDATNVIPTPDCALLMNIGLDHTEVLGDTVEQIAAEKAGVIKPGGAVALYAPEAPSVEALVRRVCRDRGAALAVADFSRLEVMDEGRAGQRFRYRGGPVLTLPLPGEHQRRNAAVVLEGIALLRRRGWTIPDAAVAEGLARTVWPARLELAARSPDFLIDGGHNPQCAEALAKSWPAWPAAGRRVLLLGMLSDKDAAGFAARLVPLADAVVCTAPVSPRALAPEALAALVEGCGKTAQLCPGAREALEAARRAAGPDGCVLACGSLYLAGELRDLFGLE